jgi:hypothetical protein
LLHQRLNENPVSQIEATLRELVEQQQQKNQWLMLIAISTWAVLGAVLAPMFFRLFS